MMIRSPGSTKELQRMSKKQLNFHPAALLLLSTYSLPLYSPWVDCLLHFVASIILTAKFVVVILEENRNTKTSLCSMK
jgi:hypothetical protein